MARSSDKQMQILAFLNQFLSENGYAPSVREICSAVGLKSTATVHYHLQQLQQKGCIAQAGTKKRAICVPGAHTGQIPVVGVVTAGAPILAVEQIEGYLPWDGEASCFALRVRGDSMINAAILDGDLVVVRPQSTAEHGEIVVAMLGDEATVKRLWRKDGLLRLMPENPAYAPIDAADVQIVGKVKAVLRKY